MFKVTDLRVLAIGLLSASILPLIAYAACEPATGPCAPPAKPLNTWEKSLAFGFNLTRGNSETLLATVGATARKETADDILDGSFALGYGEDSTGKPADVEDKTRNDVRANAGYRNLLSERTYAGMAGAFLFDEIADIDYRTTLNPLLGHYFVKDQDHKLALEAGPSYIFEKVGGETDSYFSPRIANRYDWTISCTSKLFQTAEALFDVNDSNNYIVNAEVGLEAAIASNLALVLTVRNNFDNQPAAGRDRNDMQVISALKVAL
jgi:putative salt-induced outer membrane protein YdiY